MAEAVFHQRMFHAGCGEEMITVALETHFGYKTYCPKHPDLDEYVVRRLKP